MKEKFRQQRERLVSSMVSSGALRRKDIINAFLSVRRELFVVDEFVDKSYYDVPLPIISNQTISQPTTVAIMTEALEPKKTDIVLEVGAGSGYQAAVLSHLVKKIYTIERIPALAEFAKENLRKAGIRNVEIILGDGTLGFKEKAPFDKIIVTARAPRIPSPLLKQLNNEAILVMPVGNWMSQKMTKLVKSKERITEENLGLFNFVPLIGKFGVK